MGQSQSEPMGSRPLASASSEDKATWWCRMLARIIGVLAGFLSMVLGIWACVSLSASCVGAGMIQVVFGFLTVAMEAPCCCMFIDFIEKISNFSDSRPHWQKAALYIIISIPAMAMCFEPSTIFGSGLIFVTGAFYGMLALGRKADRDTMLARAGGVNPSNSDAWDVNLVENEKIPNNSVP